MITNLLSICAGNAEIPREKKELIHLPNAGYTKETNAVLHDVATPRPPGPTTSRKTVFTLALRAVICKYVAENSISAAVKNLRHFLKLD